MNTMVLTRPTDQQDCLIRLSAAPEAAAAARSQVRAALFVWQVPVDSDVAILLTSDLVTEALRQQAGGTIALAVSCADGRFRVEVHGAAPSLPWPADSRAAPGPGVRLVATLSDEWGRYLTPDGEVAYFTLVFRGEQP